MEITLKPGKKLKELNEISKVNRNTILTALKEDRGLFKYSKPATKISSV